MGFLAHTKRRDDPPEQTDREIRKDCRKRRAMRESSRWFVQRSESRESSEYCRDRDMTDSHVWRRSDKDSPAPVRPNTAPTDIETTYELMERKRRRRPGRVLYSVETENNPVPDSSPFGAAVSPPGEPESPHTPISELMSRRLWQTGVFSGLERVNTSTPGSHQRPKRRRMGKVSPRDRKMETRDQKYSRAECADKATMVTPDGVTDNPESSARPHAAPIPEQAVSSSKTAKSGGLVDFSRAHGASPPRSRCNALPAIRAEAHSAECATPVDRTKIAFMAHIPVYTHQECQTDSSWPPLQPANYIEAGTQTEVPPTPQHCRRCHVPSNTPYSPYQQHDVPRELLSEEPQAGYGSPRWVLDERNQAMFRSSRPDDQEDLVLRLAAEYPQAHPALLERMAFEMQRSTCVGHGELEQTAPYHRGGHDAPVLDLIEPMESDIFDKEGRSYPWEHEDQPLETQAADFETDGDGIGPIYRHVDQETRSYRPCPIRYRASTAAALQPLARRGPVGNSPTSRITGEESHVYPQDIQYPSEQQPPRCPRPRIRSPIQKDVPPCMRGMAEHTQDENRVNIRRPSYLPAHHSQAILDDLEQERAEAYWWSKQLEFPRRYGYQQDRPRRTDVMYHSGS